MGNKRNSCGCGGGGFFNNEIILLIVVVIIFCGCGLNNNDEC